MTRAAMWALLAVVAIAAAVLSFAALRDLALLCGFSPWLAWLLPMVIDAGAAAGCLVWLRGDTQERGRRFARSLTVVLLGSSVAGNAVVHGLTAYGLAPAWGLVVAVSGVAPIVLGAVVHLAVLVAQGGSGPAQIDAEPMNEQPEGDGEPDGAENGVGVESVHAIEGKRGPDWWGTAPYADTVEGRAAELIEAGAGRRVLARELGVTEHEARRLLAARNGAVR